MPTLLVLLDRQLPVHIISSKQSLESAQLVPAGVLTVSYLGTEMSSSIVDMQQGQAVDFEAIEGEHRQLLASIQLQAATRPAEPADQLILDLQVWSAGDYWCECMMDHSAGQCGHTAAAGIVTLGAVKVKLASV